MTANQKPAVVVGGEVLTAGKADIYFEYVI
jgi:hypothetical protein